MIEKLACKMGRGDEEPNIELVEFLCRNSDAAGIKEIAGGLKNEDKAVVNDCVKVLYEIGGRNPMLITDYAETFITLLRSKNNRLAWGCMTALAKIAEYALETVYKYLPVIVAAYENGSVITVDNSISVFAGLCKAGDVYAQDVLPIILNHLSSCKPKDAPQHAERAAACFTKANAVMFIEVLKKRMPHLIPAGQTRIKKLLKALYNIK